jgi:hypothetical protein
MTTTVPRGFKLRYHQYLLIEKMLVPYFCTEDRLGDILGRYITGKNECCFYNGTTFCNKIIPCSRHCVNSPQDREIVLGDVTIKKRQVTVLIEILKDILTTLPEFYMLFFRYIDPTDYCYGTTSKGLFCGMIPTGGSACCHHHSERAQRVSDRTSAASASEQRYPELGGGIARASRLVENSYIHNGVLETITFFIGMEEFNTSMVFIRKYRNEFNLTPTQLLDLNIKEREILERSGMSQEPQQNETEIEFLVEVISNLKIDENCPICMESFGDGEGDSEARDVVKCKGCSKYVHFECQYSWVKTCKKMECVMCRQSFV